ncbi:hypothetical protein PPERSA_03716 [Pseudocohnilembus persalinus]|uniref:Uncharacterized protein n=1 Tax=Pseudocohnilembus persalinus TaxID=266149 RepID=A0A0V0QHV9_PSEPJ|nr:hypothetical protein PPERSA_03716 [Pseudocohnilembus persalinus]|eukprot:KRX01632.1 hypothetical protein PPERSA_03716 [Pseudocohnilembus persalinus]
MWATEETVITRTSEVVFQAVFSRIGASFWQRQVCPMWLTPTCISKPYFVNYRSFIIITPALLTKMSNYQKFLLNSSTNWSIYVRSAKSNLINLIFSDLLVYYSNNF